MKKIAALPVSLLMLASPGLLAQDANYHPSLTDNFILVVGAFRSDNSFTISAEGQTVDSDGRDIDFGDTVGVDESSTLVNAQLRWKFGKGRKWSLWGQYFASDASGDATLEKDVEWQDVVFGEGSFVDSGVKISVARLFVGRNLYRTDQSDFGIGAGLHNLDISAYIGGEVIVDGESTGYQRLKSSNSQPLPNIGVWYNFSPSYRWLLHGRADWISADIGDYDGTMWNFNAGAGVQVTDHFGLDLSYQYFDIDLNIKKSDWRGSVNMSYNGPVISAIFSW
jgi:opacity protein-like surface antigen